MPTKSDVKIQAEAVAMLTRLCRRETLFRIPGEGNRGEWRTLDAPYTADVARFLRGKYPTAVIANEDVAAAAREWAAVYYDPSESKN